MTRTLDVLEYSDSHGQTLRVDHTHGVIRGVKLLGTASTNFGRVYPRAVIEAALPLYEGVNVYVDHPPREKPAANRSYRDRLGQVRNCHVQADGLYGDLHYNPKHAVAEQLAWDAEHAPNRVGFSHNALIRDKAEGKQLVVQQIVRVRSVDLVADPATTQGVYESMDPSAPVDAGSTSSDPLEAVLASIETKVVEIVRGEGDPQTKAGQIKELLKKEAKVRAMLEDKPADKGGESGDKPATESVLESRLQNLERQLDVYRAKEALAATRTKVDAAIAAAKLPKDVVSDVFVSACMEARDEAALKALIEDRKKLADSIVRPRSRDQVQPALEQTGGGSGVAADAQAFARAITR